MNLESLQIFLKARIGLQFTGVAETQLRGVLTKRLSEVGITSLSDYLAHLHANDAELDVLASRLTINETYFYREAEHLRLLTEYLVPQLLARSGATTRLRILSVGCSSGEEPYSIAMALRERYGDAATQQFQISAGDLDRDILARAQAGIYNQFAFRALPLELLNRYFIPLPGQRRQLDPRIRNQVQFLHLNVLAANYPPVLQGQDILFFRNVSIYFDAPTRAQVLARLETLLNPGGYLIVGIAETLALSNALDQLTPQQHQGVFFFHHSPATLSTAPLQRPTPLITPAPLIVSVLPAPQLSTRVISDEELYQEALNLAQAERFTAALEQLAVLCNTPQAPARYLALQAHVLLEQGDHHSAAVAAERALLQEPWSAESLLLLARIARLRQDRVTAINYLRRIIYDRADCWHAHYQLAETYREAGQRDLSRREYRIALQQASDPKVLTSPMMTLLPSRLSPRDLCFLCERQLSRLDAIG